MDAEPDHPKGLSARLATEQARVDRRRNRWHAVLLNVAGFGCFMLIWATVVSLGLVSRQYLPSPIDVWNAFVAANSCRDVGGGRTRCGVQNYYLWEHLLASLQRIGLGLAAAVVVGIGVGFAMGMLPCLRTFFSPLLNFVRSLPPLGYIGLVIVWVGIGEASKFWLLFLAAFPPITLATIEGVASVGQDHLKAARALGAGRWQQLRFVVLPSTLPSIVQGVRLATGFAWTTVVAAELNNGIPGIGALAYLSGTQLQTPLTMACVIVIGLMALSLDSLIRWLGERAVPWQGKG